MSARLFYIRSTLGGLISIVLWGALPSLFLLAGEVNNFQRIALLYSFALLCVFPLEMRSHRKKGRMRVGSGLNERSSVAAVKKTSFAHRFRQSWHELLTSWGGGAVLVLMQLCFNRAFAIAPASAVEMICYLWPLLQLLSIHLWSRKTFHTQQVIALGVSATGLITLFSPSLNSSYMSLSYLPGYLLSAAGALFWILYNSVLLTHHNFPREQKSEGCNGRERVDGETKRVPMDFTISDSQACGKHAIVSKGTHIDQPASSQLLVSGQLISAITIATCASFIEGWSRVTPLQVLVLFVQGGLANGVSLILWQQGLRFGGRETLCLCANFVPLISLVGLALLNLEQINPAIYVGGTFLSIAPLIYQGAFRHVYNIKSVLQQLTHFEALRK